MGQHYEVAMRVQVITTGCGGQICALESRLVPGRVKPMTYKTDTCNFLTWSSAIIENDKDWLLLSQENMTEWDIWSHGVGGLTSQVGRTIKSPGVCTVTSRYPS